MAQEREKDFSVADDLDGSVPNVGFTTTSYPLPMNFIGKLKKLRYYPSAIYKDLAGRGKFGVIVSQNESFFFMVSFFQDVSAGH